MMLGRHVYRVRPTARGDWQVLKEGEAGAQGTFRTQDEAVAAAERLATAGEPSRLVIEAGNGALADERLYGKDDAAILDDEPPR
ncbi:MAG: DUF2188 domain-containing protein [Stellaceae bacterium]